MAEINKNNWWQKIEQSDGDNTRSAKEGFAIDFLNKNKNRLPADRFMKLVEQTAEITKKNDIQKEQIERECQEALERLKKNKEGETFFTSTVKKTAYLPFGIEEDLKKNNDFQNFSKGVIDELLSLPEIVELLITNPRMIGQIIEALKNTSWQQIKESFPNTDNPYETGKAAVFTIILLTGVGGAIKSAGGVMAKKLATAPILKVAKKEATQLAKGVAKETVVAVAEKGAKTILKKEATQLAKGVAKEAVKNSEGVTKKIAGEVAAPEFGISSGLRFAHSNSFNALMVGQTAIYSLSKVGNHQENTISITNIGGGLYDFRIGDHESVSLTKNETRGYIESFRFLEDTGLGYLVRAIPPRRLSDIIVLAGKDGHRVDNKDGNFTDHERFYFLKSLGRTLGIDGVYEAINLEQTKNIFKKNLYSSSSMIEGGLERKMRDAGFVGDTGLNIDKFERNFRI